MRPQTCLQVLTPLLSKPYFTSKQVRSIGVSISALNHYIKIGKIKRIRRGVYQGSEYKNVDSFRWKDLVEAVYSIPGGVICLISALAVYDLTEEFPRQHWIGIRHGTSAKRSRQIKIVRFRDLELGKTEINLEGESVPVFDRERTVIDAFRYLSRETAIKALKAAITKDRKERLDLIKLEAYARRLRFDIAPYLQSVTI